MSLNIKAENYVNMTISCDEFGRRTVGPAYYESLSHGTNFITGGAHLNGLTPLASPTAALATTVNDCPQASAFVSIPPKINLRVESFFNSRLTCKKFGKQAVGQDGLTPLAAAAAAMSRKSASNSPPSACVCIRPKVRVICMSCNFSMLGRREIACPQHHNIKYLNDLKVCPNCGVSKKFLKEERN